MIFISLWQAPWSSDLQIDSYRDFLEYVEAYVSWRTANRLQTSATPLGTPRRVSSPAMSLVTDFLEEASDPVTFANPDTLKLLAMKIREQHCRWQGDARGALLAEARWLAEDFYRGRSNHAVTAQHLARAVQTVVRPGSSLDTAHESAGFIGVSHRSVVWAGDSFLADLSPRGRGRRRRQRRRLHRRT